MYDPLNHGTAEPVGRVHPSCRGTGGAAPLCSEALCRSSGPLGHVLRNSLCDRLCIHQPRRRLISAGWILTPHIIRL